MKKLSIRKNISMAVGIAISLSIGLSALLTATSQAQAQSRPIALSHYIFPEFTEGYIFLKGGPINKGALNFNALTEEVVFMSKGKVLAIGENEIARVDSVLIAGRKFVVFNNKFAELLFEKGGSPNRPAAGGFRLFAEHKCSVIPPGKPGPYGTTSQTSSTVTLSSIIGGGTVYNLSLPDGYKTKPYTYYWIEKDGNAQKFSTIKQIQKAYPAKADAIKSYLKSHKVKIEDYDSVRDFVIFLEE